MVQSINPKSWFIFYCGDVRPVEDNEFSKIRAASDEFFDYIQYLLTPMLRFHSAEILREGVDHVFVPFTIVDMIDADLANSNRESREHTEIDNSFEDLYEDRYDNN